MPFDLDRCLARAMAGQLLEEQAIAVLVHKLKEILFEEPNLVPVSAPVTCVGDIHGQFWDLLEIFKVSGPVPFTSYLFMGDYVDRGSMSVEVITLLCLLKLKHPQQVHMIRGNHETRSTTQSYGFYYECQSKYHKVQVWQLFTDLFDYLPVGAIIGGRIFAVHGGLSPAVELADQISAIDRFSEIPHSGAYADLVWSDPSPDEKVGFVVSCRGAGFNFGAEVLHKFLRLNHFEHMTRAHQLCQDGFVEQFDKKLSTVWSAPNYLFNKNLASVMEVDEHCKREFNIFTESPENLMNKYKPIQTNLNIVGIKDNFFS